jgi:predicted DCC family thiol-disulfide oxidoreductase YuxK
MKPEKVFLAFLFAPLVAFPLALGGILVLKIVHPVGFESLPMMLYASRDAGGSALGYAYRMMFFLGLPMIFVLRRLKAFRPRPLEVGFALLGGLPFLPEVLRTLLDVQDRVPVDWWAAAAPVAWLLIGTLSGLFAGRVIWFVAGEPLPEESEAEIHHHLPAAVSRTEVDPEAGLLPAAADAALTVLYDVNCALCRRARSWLADQPKYVPMAFVAAGSREARRRFPDLDHDSTLEELTVIGWGGEVYRGAKGWVMCLWALKRYRSAALRMSSPEMLPVARRLIAWVSRNRFQIGETAGWTK